MKIVLCEMFVLLYSPKLILQGIFLWMNKKKTVISEKTSNPILKICGYVTKKTEIDLKQHMLFHWNASIFQWRFAIHVSFILKSNILRWNILLAVRYFLYFFHLSRTVNCYMLISLITFHNDITLCLGKTQTEGQMSSIWPRYIIKQFIYLL